MPLGGRAFEIVTVLVQSASEFVTKDHLMERVWPGAIVGEGTIHVHISAVRKALGPDRGLLKTASGRGYRLLGNWAPQHREGTAARVDSPPTRTPGAPPANNFPPLIARYFHLRPEQHWDPTTAIQGLAIGILTTLLFTLPTLLGIRRIKPGVIFRREMVEVRPDWKHRLRDSRG